MIYDQNWNVLDDSEIDLSVGAIVNIQRPKEGVVPVDDITKFFYPPEELEEVAMYIIDTKRANRKNSIETPTELDRLEARLTYLEIMTGFLEV